MVNEICLVGNIGAVLYKIGSIPHTEAQKRWRRAYFSIFFTQTVLSASKVSKAQNGSTPVLELLAELEIDQESSDADDKSQKFRDISRADLNELMESKNMEMLNSKFHGVSGLAKSLHTTLEDGIISRDIESRKLAFGSNIGKKPTRKGFFHFLWENFNDTNISILILCVALSINENGAQESWYEGSTIFGVLIVVLSVSVVTSFIQEKRFHSLRNANNIIWIEVTRQGRRQKVSISDVVVGDVVYLNIGDQIPACGLLISGHSLLVDESNLTGVINLIEADANTKPFLFSGSKVVDGYAKMLVISVGMNTSRGKMMSPTTTSYSNDQTLLQSRIKELTSSIEKFGRAVATLLLVIMLIRHFFGYSKYKNGKWDYKEEYMDTMDKIRTFMRTLIASAENIPLAVTLTLAYCRKKMIGDQVMVRNSSACETMGSVSVICTGKTGMLTMNQMQVSECWIGFDQINSSVDSKVLQLYHQGVGLNTTGCVYNTLPGMTPEYSGSPTEKAILTWGVTVLRMDIEKLRKDFTTESAETFNSKKKRSGVSIRNKEDGSIHVHWKGGAEIILQMCSNYYQKNGITKSITTQEKKQFEKIIQRMASKGLKCIAFAHKDKGNECYTDYKELNEEGLTLLGIVGIQDPCRPGAEEAINTCRSAKVNIKMITGENLFTAKAIARKCGILKAGQQVNKGDVITGEEFRNYTDAERMKKVNSIRVMARSTPSDKLLLVQCLKRKGEVVAVTGHDSNDAPALREADIGLSMGIHGTEEAKESSDIVILDDDFSSVVMALKWGRCAYFNIQKFVQFQLTVNIAALVINFVAAAFATEAPLSVVQLLWVNIIMDILSSLALATDQPDIDLMHKRPVRRDAPFITNVMWRNILAQSMYQVTILLTLHFKGEYLFNVDESAKNTIVFNTFVFCQVCNLINSRKLEERNVFKDLLKNRLFLGIVGAIALIQVVMVEFLNNFADTKKLNMEQWGVCIGVGVLTWPLAWFVKLIPVPGTPLLSFIKVWN